MPFKLKLKKSRQYNVSSKNLLVISVELLDNTTVECTLSSQSLGQECLSNVCQRLGLQQPQYFGLRFLSKKSTFWWVDLQRPLKKQLDKYAQEICSLYLGVMYFVSDVNLLRDEVTRYHYFLQLKSDIIEGKLHCNEEQMILFASYSLQAEFGDHDPERHTTEYLTNFGLLPKHMARGKEHQEAVLEQVINMHRSLQGLSQQLAEIYYIMEAQHLDGYGQECFAAKDANGITLFLGVSLLGILIRRMNDQPSLFFQWDQIINLVHHKRCFGIEYHNGSKVLHIFMEDTHLAKYVWKTCIQQHRFYTKNEGSASVPASESTTDNSKQPSVHSSNVITNSVQNKKEQSGGMSQLQESQESLDGLGVYHTDGAYSEHVASVAPYGRMVTEGERIQEQNGSKPPHHPVSMNPSTSSSLHALQPLYSQPLHHGSVIASSTSLASVHQSKSDISQSLYQQPQLHILQNKRNIDMETKSSVLPIYRQAPDYDTAIRLKYGIQSCSAGDLSPSSPMLQPQNTVASNNQRDMSHIYSSHQVTPVQTYVQTNNYSEFSHFDASEQQPREASVSDPVVLPRHFEHIPTNLHLPAHTYSSPELTLQKVVSDMPSEHVVTNMPLPYQFKPPPPYPYKQRSSSSTPDLTRNHQGVAIKSSTANSRELFNNNTQTATMTEANKTKSNLKSNLQVPLPTNSSPDLVAPKNIDFTPNMNNIHLENYGVDIQGYQLSSEPKFYSNVQGISLGVSDQRQNYVQTTGLSSAESGLNPSNYHQYVNENVSNHTNDMNSQNISGISSNHVTQTLPNYNLNSFQASVTENMIRRQTEPIILPTALGKRIEKMQIIPSKLSNPVPPVSFQQQDWNNVSREMAENMIPIESMNLNLETGSSQLDNDSQTMGPMLVAAMNGLTLSRPDIVIPQSEEVRFPKDARIVALESRLAEGQVFLEFERILKKKPVADFTTAILPENIPRNRFKDVFPYEENRVHLTPTSENKTGYINASHMNISVSGMLKSYIAAQGPLPNTLYSFWQMIWEHHVCVVVMLTEVQEQGRDKCFPYWPQEENNKLQIGEFQIIRNFSMSSSTYVTCSLTLCHVISQQQRTVWHIQYTDWPDHSCPQDIQGFITFMGEVDAVRRHTMSQQSHMRLHTPPVVVHCSAGVGRSGVVILCDIMLYALDHNQPIDIPKVLTQLRLQRMLTVQTLAQYKFVYSVLIRYLMNSRLI